MTSAVPLVSLPLLKRLCPPVWEKKSLAEIPGPLHKEFVLKRNLKLKKTIGYQLLQSEQLFVFIIDLLVVSDLHLENHEKGHFEKLGRNPNIFATLFFW